MHYKLEVQRFWHIGKLLFHTKFFEFMRGFDSDESIYFPVPRRPIYTILTYQKRNHSGFIQEILEAHIKREGICTIIAVTTLSFCLCIRKLFQD